MPDLLARFHEAFPRGKGDIVMARAPGRINLIGEHTDYNEGFVLPVAVDREVRVLGQRRPDDRVVVKHLSEKGVVPDGIRISFWALHAGAEIDRVVASLGAHLAVAA